MGECLEGADEGAEEGVEERRCAGEGEEVLT